MANWDEGIPSATRIAFPTGASDLAQVKADVREILNTFLSNNALPTPPATLADYDSQIPTPGPAVVPAPLRGRGDRIDLRGCTYRSAAPISRAAINTTNVASFVNATGLQIVVTPVSPQSVIEFRLLAWAHVYNAAGVFSHATTTRYGAVRIYNTTDAAALTPVYRLGVGLGQSGGANTGTYDWCTLIARVTGLTGAHTFDVQMAVGDVQTTFDLHGDFTPSLLWYIEYV